MAERNQKVFERVRQELVKSPKMGSRELYVIAQEFDKSISQDSLQQFHARYVLPLKREGRGNGNSDPATRVRRTRKPKVEVQSEKTGGGSKGRQGSRQKHDASLRDQVRSVLLEFARDFADAESRSEIVQVLSRVDDYVDRIARVGS